MALFGSTTIRENDDTIVDKCDDCVRTGEDKYASNNTEGKKQSVVGDTLKGGTDKESIIDQDDDKIRNGLIKYASDNTEGKKQNVIGATYEDVALAYYENFEEIDNGATLMRIGSGLANSTDTDTIAEAVVNYFNNYNEIDGGRLLESIGLMVSETTNILESITWNGKPYNNLKEAEKENPEVKDHMKSAGAVHKSDAIKSAVASGLAGAVIGGTGVALATKDKKKSSKKKKKDDDDSVEESFNIIYELGYDNIDQFMDIYSENYEDIDDGFLLEELSEYLTDSDDISEINEALDYYFENYQEIDGGYLIALILNEDLDPEKVYAKYGLEKGKEIIDKFNANKQKAIEKEKQSGHYSSRNAAYNTAQAKGNENVSDALEGIDSSFKRQKAIKDENRRLRAQAKTMEPGQDAKKIADQITANNKKLQAEKEHRQNISKDAKDFYKGKTQQQMADARKSKAVQNSIARQNGTQRNIGYDPKTGLRNGSTFKPNNMNNNMNNAPKQTLGQKFGNLSTGSKVAIGAGAGLAASAIVNKLTEKKRREANESAALMYYENSESLDNNNYLCALGSMFTDSQDINEQLEYANFYFENYKDIDNGELLNILGEAILEEAPEITDDYEITNETYDVLAKAICSLNNRSNDYITEYAENALNNFGNVYNNNRQEHLNKETALMYYENYLSIDNGELLKQIGSIVDENAETEEDAIYSAVMYFENYDDIDNGTLLETVGEYIISESENKGTVGDTVDKAIDGVKDFGNKVKDKTKEIVDSAKEKGSGLKEKGSNFYKDHKTGVKMGGAALAGALGGGVIGALAGSSSQKKKDKKKKEEDDDLDESYIVAALRDRINESYINHDMIQLAQIYYENYEEIDGGNLLYEVGSCLTDSDNPTTILSVAIEAFLDAENNSELLEEVGNYLYSILEEDDTLISEDIMQNNMRISGTNQSNNNSYMNNSKAFNQNGNKFNNTNLKLSASNKLMNTNAKMPNSNALNSSSMSTKPLNTSMMKNPNAKIPINNRPVS